MKTTRLMLNELLHDIQSGPFTVSRVCRAAGLHPSVVSRWKKHPTVEPRLSTIERLSEAHALLLAERKIALQALVQ